MSRGKKLKRHFRDPCLLGAMNTGHRVKADSKKQKSSCSRRNGRTGVEPGVTKESNLSSHESNKRRAHTTMTGFDTTKINPFPLDLGKPSRENNLPRRKKGRCKTLKCG